jgi:Family of unknown function (DUF5681)
VSRKDDERRRALTVRPGYEVGYGRPPIETRFQKGKSGNPRGRPKGAKNKQPRLNEERMKAILLEEAYRTITVRDGDKNVSVPMAQAIIRSLAVNAVKGQHRAQRLFSELLTMTERQNRALYDEWLDTAITYKVEWDKELARRASLGITGPEPLPHPDHVIIDLRNGTANIIGPATKEEKAEYDLWVGRKRMFEEELVELQEAIAEEHNQKARDLIETEIERTNRVLDLIRRAIPDDHDEPLLNLRN